MSECVFVSPSSNRFLCHRFPICHYIGMVWLGPPDRLQSWPLSFRCCTNDNNRYLDLDRMCCYTQLDNRKFQFPLLGLVCGWESVLLRPMMPRAVLKELLFIIIHYGLSFTTFQLLYLQFEPSRGFADSMDLSVDIFDRTKRIHFDFAMEFMMFKFVSIDIPRNKFSTFIVFCCFSFRNLK